MLQLIVLDQTASTAVSITGEASENVCVAVCDCLAIKCLLQTEVQAGKQHKPMIYLHGSVPQAPTYQVLMGL